jgi:hypothetical protein
MSSEQRHAERLSLSMTVQLIARGINRRACRMRDISPGGALLELTGALPEGENALKRGDVIILRMFLGQKEAAREHELRAKIAHVDTAFLGINFFSPDDDTLQALLASAGSPTSPSAGVVTTAARTLLEQLGRQVSGFCNYRLADFFKSAEEALFQAADNARSNTDQRMFFDAVTLLRKHQGAVKSRFLVALDEMFIRSDEGAALGKKRPDVSGLALVDKDQFEEWLIVKVISSRVEVSCRSQLFSLQVRLDELTGVGEGHHYHNRFVPAHICEAFQDAIAVLRPSITLERLLYQSFEEAILSGFEGMYESLNETLARGGILPEFDPSHYVMKHPDGSEELMTDVPPETASHADVVSGNTVSADMSRNAGVSAGDAVRNGGQGGGRLGTTDGTPVASGADGDKKLHQAPRSAAEFLARSGGGHSAQQRFETSQRDAKAAVSALKRLIEMQNARRDQEFAVSAGGEPGQPVVPVARFEVSDVQQNFDQLKSAGEGWRPALDKIAADQGCELAGAVQSLVQMSDGLTPESGAKPEHWGACQGLVPPA